MNPQNTKDSMCIFCDIVEGKIPSYTLYEDESVKAFLDISQTTKGHTLVICKNHYDHFLACDSDTMKHVFEVAQSLGNHLMDKLNAKGMNVLSNINEVAGQSVSHFHVHLIPRYSEDDACVIHFEESEEQDLEALVNLLK